MYPFLRTTHQIATPVGDAERLKHASDELGNGAKK
jgi:hypothetical protein